MKTVIFAVAAVVLAVTLFSFAGVEPAHATAWTGMTMASALMPAHRGIMAARAEGDANTLLAQLQSAFDSFKTENNKQIADLRKGLGDVVQTEKVDRINAEITTLQAAIDDVNRVLAAARLGGGGGGSVLTADERAHAEAFGNFFRRGVDAGLRDLEVKAAATTDNDPAGGYLVDRQTETAIDRILSTVSAMRQIAQVMAVSGSGYKKPVSLGGAGSGWVGEKQARPETASPTLAMLDYPAMEMYANPAATQQLLDDGRIDIATWLGNEVSIVFAELESAAFISGDGNNKPRGLGSYTMIGNASYAWGKIGYATSGVAAALSDASNNGIDALISLVYGLKQGYRSNGRFLMNRNTQAAVRKLKDAEGQYYWQPPVVAGQPSQLLGYPVSDDDNVDDIGAGKYPIWFGDFQRGYLIIDRVGIRVLRDPFTNKPYVMFYTTKRVGGGVQNFEAIKALKIGTS